MTTSGTAFGLTEDDAFLHALNEIIERDLTSEFFLQMTSLGYPTKNVFFKVILSTFPIHFETLLEEVSECSRSHDVEIYLSKTIFGTWWSICIVRPTQSSPYLLPQWGAGCSLSYDLAIYRSITECIQMLNAYEKENEQADRSLAKFLQQFPHLNKIAHLEVPKHFDEILYEDKGYLDLPTASQIKTICNSMIQRGFNPAKYVAVQNDLYSVVCAYVPNLERFYGITKSIPVLPLQFIAANTH